MVDVSVEAPLSPEYDLNGTTVEFYFVVHHKDEDLVPSHFEGRMMVADGIALESPSDDSNEEEAYQSVSAGSEATCDRLIAKLKEHYYYSDDSFKIARLRALMGSQKPIRFIDIPHQNQFSDQWHKAYYQVEEFNVQLCLGHNFESLLEKLTTLHQEEAALFVKRDEIIARNIAQFAADLTVAGYVNPRVLVLIGASHTAPMHLIANMGAAIEHEFVNRAALHPYSKQDEIREKLFKGVEVEPEEFARLYLELRTEYQLRMLYPDRYQRKRAGLIYVNSFSLSEIRQIHVDLNAIWRRDGKEGVDWLLDKLIAERMTLVESV